MGYSIKVLNSEEFDKLPYQFAKEAFAVTSPDKRNIFVRYTHLDDFNKMLIDHELDHLDEEIPTDVGPDGERYFLQALLAAVPAVLGAVGKGALALGTKALPAIGGGLAKGAGAIGGGLLGLGKSALGGVGNLLGGATSMLGKGAQGLGNMLLPGNPFGGAAAASALPKGAGITSAFMPQAGGGNPFASTSRGFINNFGGGFQPPSFLSSLKTGLGQGLGGSFGMQLGQGLGGVVKSAVQPQSLAGAGFLAAGMNKDLPRVPENPQSIQALQQEAAGGGSPLQQLGTNQLTGLLNQQFDPLSEPEIQASLRQLEKDQALEEDRVRDLYRNLRPGSDPSSDTTFGKDLRDVSDQFSRAKSDVLANRTRELKAQFDSQRLSQIQQAFNMSGQELTQRLALAQYDVDRLLNQLQIDYAGAMGNKSTLTNLGSNLLLTGAGANLPPTINIGGSN